MQDPLDVVEEAHSQHLVGLVEHEGLQFVQHEAAPGQVIHDPARRADHRVHAATQVAQLAAVFLAAVDRYDAEALHPAGVTLERLRHLNRELPSRGQNQDLGLGLGEIETRQQRQGERRGLAGPGLGDADQVTAREEVRNAPGLDRRRLLVADLLEGTKHRRSQVERRSGGDRRTQEPACRGNLRGRG